MGRMLHNPRYHVISLRVSDEELNLLQELADQKKVNISKLMRFAMHRLAGEYDQFSIGHAAVS